MDHIEYSNPRTSATIDNWPSGGRRVTALFRVETGPRGERATRQATGKPIKRTYAVKSRIIDGSDGKTYVAELSMYGHITIMHGNLKYQYEVFSKGDPRYHEILALFD